MPAFFFKTAFFRRISFKTDDITPGTQFAVYRKGGVKLCSGLVMFISVERSAGFRTFCNGGTAVKNVPGKVEFQVVEVDARLRSQAAGSQQGEQKEGCQEEGTLHIG